MTLSRRYFFFCGRLGETAGNRISQAGVVSIFPKHFFPGFPHSIETCHSKVLRVRSSDNSALSHRRLSLSNDSQRKSTTGGKIIMIQTQISIHYYEKTIQLFVVNIMGYIITLPSALARADKQILLDRLCTILRQ